MNGWEIRKHERSESWGLKYLWNKIGGKKRTRKNVHHNYNGTKIRTWELSCNFALCLYCRDNYFHKVSCTLNTQE